MDEKETEARPVMGTIFLVPITNWASVASPTLGCSIEISYNYVGMSVRRQINCVGGITWPTRLLKVIFGR